MSESSNPHRHANHHRVDVVDPVASVFAASDPLSELDGTPEAARLKVWNRLEEHLMNDTVHHEYEPDHEHQPADLGSNRSSRGRRWSIAAVCTAGAAAAVTAVLALSPPSGPGEKGPLAGLQPLAAGAAVEVDPTGGTGQPTRLTYRVETNAFAAADPAAVSTSFDRRIDVAPAPDGGYQVHQPDYTVELPNSTMVMTGFDYTFDPSSKEIPDGEEGLLTFRPFVTGLGDDKIEVGDTWTYRYVDTETGPNGEQLIDYQLDCTGTLVSRDGDDAEVTTVCASAPLPNDAHDGAVCDAASFQFDQQMVLRNGQVVNATTNTTNGAYSCEDGHQEPARTTTEVATLTASAAITGSDASSDVIVSKDGSTAVRDTSSGATTEPPQAVPTTAVDAVDTPLGG